MTHWFGLRRGTRGRRSLKTYTFNKINKLSYWTMFMTTIEMLIFFKYKRCHLKIWWWYSVVLFFFSWWHTNWKGSLLKMEKKGSLNEWVWKWVTTHFSWSLSDKCYVCVYVRAYAWTNWAKAKWVELWHSMGRNGSKGKRK